MTKCIYLSAVLKYNFEVLVLYLSISILCYFILHLEANVELLTSLHLFDNFCLVLVTLQIKIIMQNIINK